VPTASIAGRFERGVLYNDKGVMANSTVSATTDARRPRSADDRYASSLLTVCESGIRIGVRGVATVSDRAAAGRRRNEIYHGSGIA